MKLNWGHKLIFVFTLFGGMMSYLVYRSVKTNFDLVSKEYYKDELAYQQVIDGTRQSSTLKGSLDVIVRGDSAIVQLPADMKHEQVNGTVLFYFASDAKKDRWFELHESEMAVPLKHLAVGSYQVKVRWTSNSKQYYAEKLFFINR